MFIESLNLEASSMRHNMIKVTRFSILSLLKMMIIFIGKCAIKHYQTVLWFQ